MDFFSNEHFPIVLWIKLSFEPKSDWKNLFLSVCHSLNGRLYLRELVQKFKYGGTIGYGDSNMEFIFVAQRYVNYMQYYMMLPEQCDRLLLKALATVISLDEDQIRVCLVT